MQEFSRSNPSQSAVKFSFCTRAGKRERERERNAPPDGVHRQGVDQHFQHHHTTITTPPPPLLLLLWWRYISFLPLFDVLGQYMSFLPLFHVLGPAHSRRLPRRRSPGSASLQFLAAPTTTTTAQQPETWRTCAGGEGAPSSGARRSAASARRISRRQQRVQRIVDPTRPSLIQLDLRSQYTCGTFYCLLHSSRLPCD